MIQEGIHRDTQEYRDTQGHIVIYRDTQGDGGTWSPLTSTAVRCTTGRISGGIEYKPSTSKGRAGAVISSFCNKETKIKKNYAL